MLIFHSLVLLLCTHLSALHFHCVLFVRCAGTGDREGDSYQGVNVDDGTEAVGAVGQLVHQTTPLHVCLGRCLYHSLQGDNTVYPCLYPSVLLIMGVGCISWE